MSHGLMSGIVLFGALDGVDLLIIHRLLIQVISAA